MKIVSFSFIALVLAASIASADDKKPATPAAPPAPAAEVSKADADKFMAFFNKIIDAVVANQTDCPKMAGALNKVMDSNADLIAAGKKAKADHKDLPKEYKDKIETRVKNDLLPALQKKCFQDKDVQKAMERADS